MKKRILIPILILMSLLTCVSLSACSGDGGDPDETWSYVETEDPNATTGPVVDEEAVKAAAVTIFNNIAKNPEKAFYDMRVSKKNLKIENIYVGAEGMLGFEDPNIETIYITDNVTHTVYRSEDVYTQDYIPTDEYSFVGEYGSYTIQYDGFTYRYDFSPAEEVDREGINIAIPEIFAEQMWYNPTEQCFMIDSVAIVDILRYYVESGSEEDSLIDLSAIEPLLDSLYIDCYFNLNEDMTDISYLKILAISAPEDGLSSEVFSLRFGNKDGNVSFKMSLNYLMTATVNFAVTKTSDTTSTVEFIALFGSTANVIDQLSLTMSADITTAEDPYIHISGFLKEKVEIAENLIKSSERIESTYFGRYKVNNKVDCDDVYVYDDKIKAYIVFSNYDQDGYAYVGYNPYYDSTMGCLGTLNLNTSIITITTHTASETLEAALQEKYSGAYTSEFTCGTLYVYDEDYEAYVLFDKQDGQDFYTYDRFMLDAVYGFCCHAMIDFETNTITVVNHSALEKTVEELQDMVFDVYNLEKGACAQIIVYDNTSGYYLLFSIDGGKARYSGYSSYEFVNACLGDINVGSRTITITEHPHNNAV